MKSRYKPNEQQTTSFEMSLSALPIDRPVAVYYRQSTIAQVGNISTSIQTIDIPAILRTKGWAEDKIILIDADEGVSGQTTIDEREGMKGLFMLITTNAIGTVACQDEDRLFRDITQIQVNVFIEACRVNRVLVLTPMMVYDFAHPTMGQYHIKQFRYKCEAAADYITTVIKGKLYGAKMRLMNEGRWAGGNAPIGFMVDQRRNIDGMRNPNWRKYVEFEPYANVVRQWFALFNQNNGNLRKTQVTIEKLGLFPDLSLPIPEGFYYKKPKRLLPSSSALSYSLINVAYIGHWVVQGKIIIRNNHPCIVPLDQFMQAYNHMAEQDFAGNPNPDYRPFRENARPTKESDRPVERPLLSGLIYTPYEGDWATVGTHWDDKWGKYRYYFHPYHGVRTYAWSKTAAGVDALVVTLALRKLEQTFTDGTWEQSLAIAKQKAGGERELVEQQLNTLNETISGYLTSLSLLKTPELIVEIERRYGEAKKEQARLQEQVSTWSTEETQLQDLLDLRKTFTEALTDWAKLERERKCKILHALIDWISAEWDSKELHLTITWRDGSTDDAVSRKINGAGEVWLAEEDALLKKLVRSSAGQVEIMQQLPKRTWCALMERVRQLTPGEKRPRYKRYINRLLTYEQYQCQEGVDSESDSRSRARRVRWLSLRRSCWWRP
jgi:DNA invertase Pin-like site-specific DNA recombinase